MKVYGYTKVDSEGFNCGGETITHLYATKKEAVNAAFADYVAEFKYAKENEELEEVDDKRDTKEIFTEDFLRTEYAGLIQRCSSHCQFEYIEQEVGS